MTSRGRGRGLIQSTSGSGISSMVGERSVSPRKPKFYSFNVMPSQQTPTRNEQCVPPPLLNRGRGRGLLSSVFGTSANASKVADGSATYGGFGGIQEGQRSGEAQTYGESQRSQPPQEERREVEAVRKPKYPGGFLDSGFNVRCSKPPTQEHYESKHDNDRYGEKPSFGFDAGPKKETAGATASFQYADDSANFRGFGVDFSAIMERSKREEEAQQKWQAEHPIKKNFYEEHPQVAALTPQEADRVRSDKNGITVRDLSDGGNRQIPNPIQTFEQAFHNYPEILSEMRQFDAPSPIQCQMWPIAMCGHDVIGIAQTGCGKTLAFLLPAFLHIDGQPTPRKQRKGPTVLILTPTRELAQQIEREVRKYHYRDIRSVCVYGGGCRKTQTDICESGVEIVIATPGRLNDLVEARSIDLTSVTFMVLDEADRMLDMGFMPQIQKILLDIRSDRHTIMTSATWPPLVRRLGEKYTKDAFHIVVGSLDLKACKSVKQTVIMMPTDYGLDVEELKREKVMHFVENMAATDKVLIFVGKKQTADGLASDMLRKRVNCQSIHGDRDQSEREKALKELRRGDTRILVATDVASRGLDVPDITHVINYDFPRNIEDYVHRVGRSGRAGKNGESITLFCRYNRRQAQQLIDILRKGQQEVPPQLTRMAEIYARQEGYAASTRRNGGAEGGVRRSFDRKGGVCDPITGEVIGFVSKQPSKGDSTPIFM